MRRRLPFLTALLALAFAGMTTAVGAASGAPLRFLVLDAVVGLTFAFAGSVAWRRRPEALTGPLLVLCTLLWFLGSYAPTGRPILTTIGFAFEGYYDVVLAALVLVLPGRTLAGRDRLLVATMAMAFVVRSLGRLLLQDPVTMYPECVGCPANPFAILPNRAVFETVETWASVLVAIVAVTIAVLAARRLVAARPVWRRILWPILVAGIAAMAAATLAATETAYAMATGRLLIDLPEPWHEVVEWTIFATRGLVPIGLVVGSIRARMAAGPLVGLAVELGRVPAPDRLEAALRAALGDPSVMLLRPVPGEARWSTTNGTLVDLPSEDGSRAVTMLDHAGAPLAAIIHDPVLREDPSLFPAVTAVLRLAVENERLEAEVRAQLDAVRASRARLVGSAEEQRRRLERDLHDGAQQRLIAVGLALQRARAAADDLAGAPEVRAELEATAAELQGAIQELRELARGLHPAILEEEGLAAAVAALSRRVGIPVQLTIDLDGRLPRIVESTAYFTVAEALTNTARHAKATRARVSLGTRDGRLLVEVEDDGVGGAELSGGTGLRGLGDRLGAVDGSLEVTSVAGGGTRLRAEIPVGP